MSTRRRVLDAVILLVEALVTGILFLAAAVGAVYLATR